MFFQKYKYFLLLNLVLGIGTLGAQMSGSEDGKKNQDLVQIRAEIEKYRSQLNEKKAREKNLVRMISAMDKEVDLAHDYVIRLRKENKQQAAHMDKLKSDLTVLQAEYEKLKALFNKRIVYFYKYGRARDLELLLTAHSWHQAYLWLKYEKMVAQNDYRNIQNIQKKIDEIGQKTNLLRLQTAEYEKVLSEKTAEEARLKKRRSERKDFLDQVRKDKEYLAQRLADQEEAARQISGIITQQEERRFQALEKGEKTRATKFRGLKGRLIWPTAGKIITRFGKQKHPTLKTITENLGIEIQAPFGADVRSVCDGVVTTITWQRGRGNIVIVNHFDGFYTVYTHLSEITVQMNQEISIGQVIGKVGDSGSLTGPILHFEIWQHTNNLNPEDWLL